MITIFANNCNTSIQNSLSKENLISVQIPIPKDISTIEPQLSSLEKLHKQITTSTEQIPQKEKEVCELIKKLTDDGKIGEDYDEYGFNDLVEYQNKSKKYKASAGLEKGRYKFYTSSQDKIAFIDDEPLFKEMMLIMGRKGNSSVHYDKMFSCEHDDVYVIKVKNIDTRYMHAYIKINIEWFARQMNGSTVKGTSKEILGKFIVKVLKSHMMEKYEIQKLFDEIDELKSILEQNKIEYATKNKELFEKFEQKEIKANEINTTEENTTENIKDESQKKPTKKIIKKEEPLDDVKVAKKKVIKR
jgi:hypothetical protein